MRLFVAVELSEAIREQVRALLDGLKRDVPEVRWARPEALHVTLKFLGEVESERVDPLCEALERASGAGAPPPFDIEVEGLGTFGDRKRPRVVWAGLRERTGALEELQGAVEQACEALGFPLEERRFHPHLTLARIKGPMPSLGRALATRSGVRLGSAQVGSFALVRSELQPDGALHTVLKRFALGGPGKEAR